MCSYCCKNYRASAATGTLLLTFITISVRCSTSLELVIPVPPQNPTSNLSILPVVDSTLTKRTGPDRSLAGEPDMSLQLSSSTDKPLIIFDIFKDSNANNNSWVPYMFSSDTKDFEFKSKSISPKSMKKFFRKKPKKPFEMKEDFKWKRPMPSLVYTTKQGTNLQHHKLVSDDSTTPLTVDRRTDDKVQKVKNQRAWWTQYLLSDMSKDKPLHTSNVIGNPDFVQYPPDVSEPSHLTSSLLHSVLGTIRFDSSLNPSTQFGTNAGFLLNQATKTRQFYGRNQLFRPISLNQSRKYMSQLASPYSYNAYQSLQKNYFDNPLQLVKNKSDFTGLTEPSQSAASHLTPMYYKLSNHRLSPKRKVAQSQWQQAPVSSTSNSDISDLTRVKLNTNSLPIIKFSAKDSIAYNGKPRESRHSSSQLFDEMDESATFSEPKKVKMGSFIKPRSLWRSDGERHVYLEKFDMSDIFCKTKFKPISTVRIDSISREGRTLKRSFAFQPDKLLKESESKRVQFVNSNWTSVVKPSSITVHRRVGAIRNKRQVLSSSQFHSILNRLPQGTKVKEIDPQTTELLVRLLRNTRNEFSLKNITKIFYVHLTSNLNAEDQAVDRSPDLRSITDTTRDLKTTRPWNRPTRRPTGENSTRRTQPPPPPPSTPTFVTTPKVPTRVQFESNRNQNDASNTRNRSPSKNEFVLSEQDFEYGELLCDGKFSGAVADPRHDCRLYFECNQDTIDTFACPETHRFDAVSQQCRERRLVQCSKGQ